MKVTRSFAPRALYPSPEEIYIWRESVSPCLDISHPVRNIVKAAHVVAKGRTQFLPRAPVAPRVGIIEFAAKQVCDGIECGLIPERRAGWDFDEWFNKFCAKTATDAAEYYRKYAAAS